MMMRFVCAAIALAATASATNRTIVVTGATGRSGSEIYLLLKAAGVNVRGVVRNISKARQYLGCSKCDESEGIFVGDITRQETLKPAMVGADSLVITTGRAGNEKPEDILFTGVRNQFGAFLGSSGPEPKDRHVILISMQETTLLDTFLNKILARFWGGWSVGFYSLQGEAALMDAGVPFTILKACGLDDAPAKQKHLLAGHYDKDWSMKDGVATVSRHDVARVLAAAALNPQMASGLRFDFCAKSGTPQGDGIEILKDAMFSWDPRKTRGSAAALVI